MTSPTSSLQVQHINVNKLKANEFNPRTWSGSRGRFSRSALRTGNSRAPTSSTKLPDRVFRLAPGNYHGSTILPALQKAKLFLPNYHFSG